MSNFDYNCLVQGPSFIVSLSTAVVLQIKPASARKSCNSYSAQDDNKELYWMPSILSDTAVRFATFPGSHSRHLSEYSLTGFDTKQDHR
jgi:hypothetical protein